MPSALEFYSGIGGLHLALERANLAVSVQVLRAFDWDPSASKVYTHNFGEGIVDRCDISSLAASDLIPYKADIWLLSPACQPYTVLNPNAKGGADPRAKSFLHLMTNVLPELVAHHQEPHYIFVENVAGFEKSTTRQIVFDMLESLQYSVAEFLLTPLQFGIPNSRLRYYLLARKGPFPAFTHRPSEPQRSIPNEGPDWNDPRFYSNSNDTPVLSLQNFLDEDEDFTSPSSSASLYSVPPKILRSKHAPLFDIVKPSSTRTCCFTRGYTHMIEGSTILQQTEDLDTTNTFNMYAIAAASSLTPPDQDPLNLLLSLRLRYFTPTELLRLLCFNPLYLPTPALDSSGKLATSYETYLRTSSYPTERKFRFPDTVSLKSQYRLIGNSVNVYVVSKLLSYLIALN